MFQMINKLVQKETIKQQKNHKATNHKEFWL